jgi:hypothetical protein
MCPAKVSTMSQVYTEKVADVEAEHNSLATFYYPAGADAQPCRVLYSLIDIASSPLSIFPSSIPIF